ncbi:hypothetical protein BGX34_000765, partial [Mortierella sp. NVP85]
LSVIYSAYCSGKSDPLPPLSIQQPDYAAWQKQWLSGERLETHITYWKNSLTDAPVLLGLPTDRPRPPEQSYKGDNIPIHLDSDLTRALKQLSPENGITAYMAILTAWACVLSRMSGQDDIVIGSPTANRNHPQIESLLGVFINTLALRIDLSGHPTLRQVLERVRQTCLDAQNHQGLPFQQVVDIVQPPRSLSYSPLFQAMFVVQINEISKWHLPGLEVAEIASNYKIARFDVNLGLYQSDNDSFMGGLSFSTALFDRATMERHVGYLYSMLHAMVSDVDQPVTSVDLISQAESDLVLGKWNETHQDYLDHLCIHHLFEQQVECTPQATALVFNDQSMTYAELNERANQLAHHLLSLGVQPETLVAICVERSFAMIVGVLGILKAGAAYVPLDPTYASGRLRDILSDAAPTIVIADESGRRALEGRIHSALTVIDPDSVIDFDKSKSCTPSPQIQGMRPNSLAYVIFTSGSTGKPKGVMIEHRGVVNLAQAHAKLFGVCQDSRFLQFASLSFDASVSEIILPLSCGGSLYLLVDSIRMDRDRLWEYMAEHAITHATLTPSFLQDGRNFPIHVNSLVLVLGGEVLSPTLLQNLVAQGYTVFNDFGPTETTVSAITWNCPQNFEGDSVPIGRPIANKTVYILDRNQKPVPLGAIGELYIGGVGVARGYLNRPELTEKAFLQDPFAEGKDARMYKTGDLARYLPDGNIVFVGRNDHQVKIRGFRIELGEIEARLIEHPLVDTAVVIANGEGIDMRLVGYVVARPNDNLLSILRLHLTGCLPEYMVPAAIVRLDSLPLSSNDKLDRARLPLPDINALVHQQYEQPHGEIEITLMKIWMDLLKVDRIGRHDNFFMLGGHSLLAMRMISQVQSLMGFKITVGSLFKAPTIAELVPHLLITGNTQEDAFDVLLPIKPRGTRLPLFCVHHGYGVSWSYIGLSKYLHQEQPIYGLQLRGLFDNGQPAATLEDMALDYIEQMRRVQPRGPYCLLGYSFGGIVVHTMAAHLERQGERMALLAVMDTIPRILMANSQTARDEHDNGEDNIAIIKQLTNRLEGALPDGARPYIEKAPQVIRHLDRLAEGYAPLSCRSGMTFFRAMVRKDPSRQPVSPNVWKPYVMGEIDVFDINCEHDFMDLPEPLGEIGGVLAQRLNEIHAGETEGL